ncbi:hypothetical protein ACH66Z_08815 [Klebsiella pneumoniae]|uniref:hypothetical protein n=1 Tax=Klebsiella pneumoniae TaxID=573 RepID=UPI000BA88E9F|nr:hypothetical protein [Klebsiella pneumoniae]HDX8975017.1 hypothetical protein [Klebsiella michiganensis]ASV89665.1 hypothetical protein CI946_04725 [Klebsiella pneumoniae]AWA72085.1 hypothetical protein C6M02_04145 [Klebsiella pneumoniae]KAB1699717.1 hypothetical protein FNE66_00565 [Klebsiella pneumoniae]KAB1715666.1 hypothetical protein FNE67_00565 [Klebsiella pneumoniae]
MKYLAGDYISTDSRYGDSRKSCYAFADEAIKEGDIFISTIRVFADKNQNIPIFDFNVGTINGDPIEALNKACETFLQGFVVISE